MEILPQKTFMAAGGNPRLMALYFTTLCNQGSVNRTQKNFIPACPLGKQLSHFACPGLLLALLS